MAGGGVKINNISVRGGADGATFVPSVDADGNLTWENNKGYNNPPTVNIKGAKGDKGDAGTNGVNGRNALVATEIYTVMGNPQVGFNYQAEGTAFSRTPVVGDNFFLIWHALTDDAIFCCTCVVIEYTNGTCGFTVLDETSMATGGGGGSRNIFLEERLNLVAGGLKFGDLTARFTVSDGNAFTFGRAIYGIGNGGGVRDGYALLKIGTHPDRRIDYMLFETVDGSINMLYGSEAYTSDNDTVAIVANPLYKTPLRFDHLINALEGFIGRGFVSNHSARTDTYQGTADHGLLINADDAIEINSGDQIDLNPYTELYYKGVEVANVDQVDRVFEDCVNRNAGSEEWLEKWSPRKDGVEIEAVDAVIITSLSDEVIIGSSMGVYLKNLQDDTTSLVATQDECVTREVRDGLEHWTTKGNTNLSIDGKDSYIDINGGTDGVYLYGGDGAYVNDELIATQHYVSEAIATAITTALSTSV